MTKKIIQRAVVQAAGVAVYIGTFAWLVVNAERFFGEPTVPVWVNMIFALTLFIVSACITGSLVLLKPVLMYLDGQKKQALQLFFATVSVLAIIALGVGLVLILV